MEKFIFFSTVDFRDSRLEATPSAHVLVKKWLLGSFKMIRYVTLKNNFLLMKELV